MNGRKKGVYDLYLHFFILIYLHLLLCYLYICLSISIHGNELFLAFGYFLWHGTLPLLAYEKTDGSQGIYEVMRYDV